MGGSSNAPPDSIERAMEEEEVPEWPNGQFASERASDHFTRAKNTRKVLSEGWFEGTAFDRLHEWTGQNYLKMLQKPAKGYEEIAREVLANWDDNVNGYVYVRGHSIEFTSQVVNEYYGVPERAEGQKSLDREKKAENFILDILPKLRLAGDTTPWKMGKDKKAHSFPTTHLKMKPRMLLRFVKERIIPTKHTSNMSPMEAALVYALMEGWYINMGMEICRSISEAVSPAKAKGIPFPSLISGICAQAQPSIVAPLRPLPFGRAFKTRDYEALYSLVMEKEREQRRAPRPRQAPEDDRGWQAEMEAHMRETRRLGRVTRFYNRLTAAQMQGLPFESVREQTPDTP